MFTGLIKTQGTIRRVDQRGDCMVTIAMSEPFPAEVGDSICCQGICLTVIKINDNEFKVSLSAETMTRTVARDWAVGTVLNLEPSLSVGDALGGHFVSGHVDGLAHVVRSEKSGDSTIWEFEAPPHLARFIAAKGSVTLDGVSLTVNEVHERNTPTPVTTFTVNIIPHTAKMTSFGQLKVGDAVNLEVDMIARYVARLAEKKIA
ncbi:MAG: riboflavin synthase [Rickettsiales bacterium]